MRPSTSNTHNEGELTGAINSAVSAIGFFLTAPPRVGGYRALLAQAQAGVAVEVIIPLGYLHKSGLTETYVNKLRAAGGRFFVADLRPADWQQLKLSPRDLLLIDQQICWQPTPGSAHWAASQVNAAAASYLLEQLRHKSEQPAGSALTDLLASTGKPGANRLEISLGADRAIIGTGEQVRLHWVAPDAAFVELHPAPGRVPTTGTRTFTLSQPTEFSLTARLGTAATTKVLKIGIDQRVGLRYWLLAGPAPGVEPSRQLTEPAELPGHFGVPEGVSLVLCWEAGNALVTLLDGAPVDPVGRRELAATGRQRLQLEVRGIQGDRLEKEIVVKAFPLPAALPEITEPATAFSGKTPEFNGAFSEQSSGGLKDKTPLPESGQPKTPVWGRLQKWFTKADK